MDKIIGRFKSENTIVHCSDEYHRTLDTALDVTVMGFYIWATPNQFENTRNTTDIKKFSSNSNNGLFPQRNTGNQSGRRVQCRVVMAHVMRIGGCIQSANKQPWGRNNNLGAPLLPACVTCRRAFVPYATPALHLLVLCYVLSFSGNKRGSNEATNSTTRIHSWLC